MPKIAALPLLCIAVIAGCSKSPTSSGGSGPDTTSTTPPSDAVCSSRVNDSESKLVECIQSEPLWQHMIDLQNIADANPGPDGHPSRNAGEPGYLASVNYVADLMRAAGYRVTIQNYGLAYAGFGSRPVFTEITPATTVYSVGTDFDASLAGSGDVTAQLQPVGGIVIPATATPTSASGCASGDFAGFVAGRVALIQRGSCSFDQKAGFASTFGASAVVIFNDGSAGDSAAAGCSGVHSIGIPVICLASYQLGQSLYQQAATGPVTVHIAVTTVNDSHRADYNLIADSPYGDTNHVVVVDAHLDAIYGAGMLDNGSGSVTILEVALKLAHTPTRNQLRFIWFGGEELGLHGSFHYTQALSPADVSRIAFDIDADVTATPNYVYAIADPANSGEKKFFPANVIPASQVGNNFFISYFNKVGLPYESRSNDGTDSYAFALIGVPNTGILTGQDCCKEANDVAIFGGTPGNYEGHLPGTDGGCVDRPFLWCDNLANNDSSVLTRVSKAVASVVFNIANDSTLGR